MGWVREMTGRNTKVTMRRHPAAMVSEDDFAVEETDLPRPGDGQALVSPVPVVGPRTCGR